MILYISFFLFSAREIPPATHATEARKANIEQLKFKQPSINNLMEHPLMNIFNYVRHDDSETFKPGITYFRGICIATKVVILLAYSLALMYDLHRIPSRQNKITIYKSQTKPDTIKGRELTLFNGASEMQLVCVSQVLESFLKRFFAVSKVTRYDVIQRVQHVTSNWKIRSKKG